MKRIYLILLLSMFAGTAYSQTYEVSQTGTFKPKPNIEKKVVLLKDQGTQNKVILFQTTLRVNTDGSPMSYHPQDPRGKTLALNNVCNAIVVKKGASPDNLCMTSFSEAIGVFEKFRDANFQEVPQGYRITWKNVLPAIEENGKQIPCVFKSGEFKGYFGSLTALKNGLVNNQGECSVDNQVNPLKVPALVLVGGENVVKNYGATVGDLLFAYNPKTQLFSAAIIGDTGPRDNLGEGSVLLNMRLRGTSTAPKNKQETYALGIEDSQVLIAIFPASKSYKPSKPYTLENINQRVEALIKERGFSSTELFIKLMKDFQPNLR